MDQGRRLDMVHLMLWIMALMALPIMIVGSFPLDTWLLAQGDWPLYVFGLDVMAITVVVVWFILKRLRRQPTVNP